MYSLKTEESLKWTSICLDLKLNLMLKKGNIKFTMIYITQSGSRAEDNHTLSSHTLRSSNESSDETFYFVSFRAVGSPLVMDPNSICRKTKRLAGKQAELCQTQPEIVNEVAKGTKLGVRECQYQFRFRRWNCTSQNKYFGKILQQGEFFPSWSKRIHCLKSLSKLNQSLSRLWVTNVSLRAWTLAFRPRDLCPHFNLSDSSWRENKDSCCIRDWLFLPQWPSSVKLLSKNELQNCHA